jgi:hypothetical protein
MTPAQVKKASKGDATDAPPDVTAFRSSKDGRNTVKIIAPYHSGQFYFQAYFGFDSNNKLNSVSLMLTAGDPHELIGALHNKYGEEERRPRPGIMRAWTWASPKDRIRALMVDEDVTVSYSPLHSSVEDGL